MVLLAVRRQTQNSCCSAWRLGKAPRRISPSSQITRFHCSWVSRVPVATCVFIPPVYTRGCATGVHSRRLTDTAPAVPNAGGPEAGKLSSRLHDRQGLCASDGGVKSGGDQFFHFRALLRCQGILALF